MQLLYFFYDLVIILLLLISSPFLAYKLARGKYRDGFWERLGVLPEEIKKTFENEPTIWVHAVSVGETVAASPIVTEIKEHFPDHKILFSTVTETGQKVAHEAIKEADGFIYFPLDFSLVVKKVLKTINPEIILITETELWPNFIYQAKKIGADVMLVNGRISDSSVRKYYYLGPYLKDMFSRIDILGMQSEQDVANIMRLGAPENKVYNTGNTKFDQIYSETKKETGNEEDYYRLFKIKKDQPVIIFGSTHSNEEEQLLPVYQRLKNDFSDLVMILAPRHIQRADEIEALYKKAGIDVIRKTAIQDDRNDYRAGLKDVNSVIILDTIGELSRLYKIADLVFIGGSLVKFGGHNIMEPAAYGKLVFFGPYMYDFKKVTELVSKYGVGIQVKDSDELADKMLYYLKNREELEAVEASAYEMISDNTGAAKMTARLALKLVNNRSLD